MAFLKWMLASWCHLFARRTNGWAAAAVFEDATVEFDQESVWVRLRTGEVQTVRWADLRRVRIMTTDQGPFVPDMFYLLEAGSTSCLVPSEAKGGQLLLERLQQPSGFDNEAVIQACGSTRCAEFICWCQPDGSETERPSDPNTR